MRYFEAPQLHFEPVAFPRKDVVFYSRVFAEALFRAVVPFRKPFGFLVDELLDHSIKDLISHLVFRHGEYYNS